MNPLISSLEEVIPAPMSRVVALEVADDGTVQVFRRTEDGSAVETATLPYRPWLLVSGPELAASLGKGSAPEMLSGPGFHRCKVSFNTWQEYDAALKDLKKLTGQSPSSPLAPYRVFSDRIQQAMIDLRIRLFRGMEFCELRRMQLDIECRSSVPGVFCNAMEPGDEIFMVALKDTDGFEHCFSTAECGGEEGPQNCHRNNTETGSGCPGRTQSLLLRPGLP